MPLDRQSHLLGCHLHSTTAGWHDAARTNVYASHLGDPLVALHERQHEAVLSGTPDGQLLSLAHLIPLHADETGQDLPPAARGYAAELLRGSRWAHEAVATYAGIKMFPADQGPSALDRFGADYRNYYHAMADVLDAAFGSTFLQLSVGRAVETAAFSSPLLARAFDGPFGAALPAPEECPDNRLRHYLEKISGSRLGLRDLVRAAAVEVCERCGVPSWDFFQDAAYYAATADPALYASVSGDVPVAVEEGVWKAVLTWLKAEGDCPLLSGPDYAAAVDRAVGYARSYGLAVAFKGSAASPTLTDHAQVDVHLQANSRIHNPRFVALPRGSDEDLAGDALFDRWTAFAVVPRTAARYAEDEWVLIGWEAADGPLTDGCYSAAAVLDWLRRRGDRRRRSLSAPKAVAMVFGCENGEELVSRVQSVAGAAATEGDARPGALVVDEEVLRACCWYYTGNWAQALYGVAEVDGYAPGQVRVGTLREKEAVPAGGTTSATAIAYLRGCWVGVLTLPGIPGLIARAHNPVAGSLMRGVAEGLIARNRAAVLDDGAGRAAGRLIGHVLQLMRAYWREF